MNYTDKIFEMLGIKPGSLFRLTGVRLTGEIFIIDKKYRLTRDLILQYYDDTVDCWLNSNYTIDELLTGKYSIELIKESTEEDKIVIAYAKLCGYEWIAKDANGSTYAYTIKPTKITSVWENAENPLLLRHSISFLSWEDEEPYYIGD